MKGGREERADVKRGWKYMREKRGSTGLLASVDFIHS